MAQPVEQWDAWHRASPGAAQERPQPCSGSGSGCPEELQETARPSLSPSGSVPCSGSQRLPEGFSWHLIQTLQVGDETTGTETDHSHTAGEAELGPLASRTSRTGPSAAHPSWSPGSGKPPRLELWDIFALCLNPKFLQLMPPLHLSRSSDSLHAALTLRQL